MAYTTIDDPSAHFHIQLYTGSGSSGLSVTNDANAGNFSPDFLWLAPRSNGDNNVIFDSSRGFNKQLKANGNDAEDTHSPARFTRESDGFDIDTTDTNYNGSGRTYVAWQWIANNGTTSTNSDGTVNVTTQVNSTAGFSIMKWNGNGNTSGTVGHSLGAKPDFIIEKYGLDGTSNWGVAYPAIESSKLLTLNGTNAFATASGMSSYNSSTFVDGNGAATGGTIAFAFKNIQGYSKFGTYTGNGSEDGPYVHLGFKPQWILFKNADAAEEWVLQDSVRNPHNPVTKNIRVDSNIAEADASSLDIDFCANGFKNRSNNAQLNSNNTTYIYMAFAQHPFVSSEGVPTTAGGPG